MKRIRGTVFDPYCGDPKRNGAILGKAVARLHAALQRIEADDYEADFSNEFTTWIKPALTMNEISFTDGLLESLDAFFAQAYACLPRQLIHRDIHTNNMLFEGSALTGFLDFDMSQKNIRIWDIAYLACSQLIENYQDEQRLKAWREICEGLIQGYGEVLPLTKEELVSLPAVFLFDVVLFVAFYSKEGQSNDAKENVKFANWLFDNKRIVEIQANN